MAAKLNQVIAVVASKKANATKAVTEIYHLVQKPELFSGLSRTYRPKDDAGEQLPPESKLLQTKVAELVRKATDAWIEMFDVVATQDYANCLAKADIAVDGKPILHQVPVTHLLFLEKQLKDVETFVSKLPTLDPADTWKYDSTSDSYANTPTETVRTKKIPAKFVKSEATKEHPAQVDVFHEDVLVGYWKTVKFSGAIPANQKNEILGRVRVLHEAIVKARELANSSEAPNIGVGKQLLKFVFEG